MKDDIENEVAPGIEKEITEEEIVEQSCEGLKSEWGSAVKDRQRVLLHMEILLEHDEVIAVPEAVISSKAEEDVAQSEEYTEDKDVFQRHTTTPGNGKVPLTESDYTTVRALM